jgi:hypothetical protein
MSLSTSHLRRELDRLAGVAVVPTELADGARRRARRDRARLVTVVAIIVALAAAGSVVAVRNLVRTQSLPVATYRMQFGLRTPVGTTQLGPVFVQSTNVQFTVFRVTGDPYAVFRDLATQLRQAGFSSSAGSLLCGNRGGSADLWTCDAGAERRTSREDFVTMSMTLSAGGAPYQAELMIQTASAPLVPNNPVPIYPGQMFEVPAAPAPFQPAPYRPGFTATETGPHDPTSDAGSFFRYPHGATPVAPPFEVRCKSSAGFVSIQSTTGSPVAAARDYVSQLSTRGVRVTGSNDTWTKLAGAAETASVIVSRGRDGTGYLFLEYCGG